VIHNSRDAPMLIYSLATVLTLALSSLKTAIEDGSMPSWEEQRGHVQQLIKEICESYDPIKDGMVVNAVTGHQEDAQEQIHRIVGLLDAPQFKSSPPFTLKRMAELLTEPFKYYPQNHLAKFLRALERVMLVSSSIDDYGQVSVDIHDVPTVEDGEKIKPDTGIVLTPIPWISEGDTTKLEKGGEETDAVTADEQDDGVKPVQKEQQEEGKQQEGKKEDKEEEETKEISEVPAENVSHEASNVSVEMADVSGDSISESMTTHDVSVEMTDADLSAEMATHDVPDEVAQEIRQVKSEETQGDLLTTVVADVTNINHKHGERREVEADTAEEEKKEPTEPTQTTEKEAPEKESTSEKETTKKEPTDKEPTEPTAQNGTTTETEEDREAKRLKTE
jgi:hypothetical protein